MEAYKVNQHEYFIETEKNIYYLWLNENENEIALDQFLKEGLSYQGLAYYKSKFRKMLPLGINTVDLLRNIYRERKKYQELQAEQLLTHPNKLLRETIKKLIDGNISS